MSEQSGIAALMPSGTEIMFLTLQGSGMFFSVCGMVGMALMLGPLNSIIPGIEFGYMFDSKLYAVLSCFGLTVIGGSFDFIANAKLKEIDKQKL